MLILEYKDIELDFCPTCKGCWLDEGELEQMLAGRTAAMQQLDWTGGVKGRRRCPRCLKPMHVVPMPNDGPEVDVCPAACGIWFDQGELRAAIRSQLADAQASPIVETLREMFGTEEEGERNTK